MSEKELTEIEKRKNLSDLISKKRQEGKVILATIDGFMEADLENLVNCQPVDGLLYDLNRDLVTCLSWVEASEDIVWVNNAASGIVIEYMSKQIDALRSERDEWRKDAEKLARCLNGILDSHPYLYVRKGEVGHAIKTHRELMEKEKKN
jgi:hypothetical protein